MSEISHRSHSNVMAQPVRYDKAKSYNELVVASRGSRFWAWLLDMIIVGLIMETIFGLFTPIGLIWVPLGSPLDPSSWFRMLTPRSLFLLGYWVLFGYYYGQSIGKMALKLVIVDESTGSQPRFVDILISSFGKAFFLPLDMLLGLFIRENSSPTNLKQRVSQRISRIVVIQG